MRSTPRDLDAWIAGILLPAWTTRALEPGRPGFVEILGPDGAAAARTTKTTLVTARLIYVFSHGYVLTGAPEALAAARHGVDFLLAHCLRPDGGCVYAVEPDGRVVDGRADLYDLAFVIFALAWFHRAGGDPEALRHAEATMRFIETRLAHAAGGFAEDDAGALPRRQNPHMHLLEACHAMAEASGEARWLDRAQNLVDLMRARLFDGDTGSLGEFFAEDWSPLQGAKGRLREPGHHFEWVWLLHHHARLTGRPDPGEAERLYAFALAHGLEALADGSPMALDEVDRDGAPVARTKLLWPQTEAIKAFAARLECLGDADAGARLETHLAGLFRHHVDPGTAMWVNQLDPSGAPVLADLPVRVLYHLLLALAEAARVKGLRQA